MAYNLIFVTASEPFDELKVSAHLDAQPDCFRDPRDASSYFICGLPSLAEHSYARCLEDPKYTPIACEVILGEVKVLLLQERADLESLRSGMEFARWLAESYELSIKSYYGDDITSKYREQGIAGFYSERVRSMPYPPWAGCLIKVGYFYELEHCDFEGVSLVKARAKSAAPDEDRIATYLDAGHLYKAATGVVEDWFADDEIAIGPPHLLTDGVYVWPVDLPYYLRTYHLRLPKAFTIHVANNGYAMPKNVDAASFKLA